MKQVPLQTSFLSLNFYDLNISDDVRILIIFTYILDDKRLMAKDYLQREKNNFLNKQKVEEAVKLIEDTENGTIWRNKK